jgi:hypothetical protein
LLGLRFDHEDEVVLFLPNFGVCTALHCTALHCTALRYVSEGCTPYNPYDVLDRKYFSIFFFTVFILKTFRLDKYSAS